MIVGFTGTRQGMTEEQAASVRGLLCSLRPTEVHHGDAIGADSDFHNLVRTWCPDCVIHVHPCNLSDQRRFCQADVLYEVLPPLLRNSDIVKAADVMIATPAEAQEQIRGGTWSTIRKARQAGKPLHIVLPDGVVRAS